MRKEKSSQEGKEGGTGEESKIEEYKKEHEVKHRAEAKSLFYEPLF